jgi:signal transduction histidine kinase/CheY-like chemotaxis protein/HAMP domain-containing protein
MTMRAKTSILTAVIIVVTLGVTGVFHLTYFENSLRDSVLNGLDTVSSASSQLISRFLADTLKEAEMIAVSLPPEALEKKDILAIEEKLKLYSEKLPKFENGMFLLDEKGTLWADYPAHPEVRGKSFAFREYFRRTTEERKGVIGTPYLSARTNLPVLTFTAPLRSSSGQWLGLLGCSVQLTSPNALEGIRMTGIGQTGYIYVYNRERLMILHPDDERILKKDVPAGANRLFDAAIEGFEGIGETVNSKGIRMLISLKQVQGTDWIIGAQQPVEEAFAPIRAAQHRTLASIILAAVAAAALAALTMTGITRPLLRLRRAVMLLGKAGETRNGQLVEHRRELEGIAEAGEIGDLTRAFQSMSEQLERTMGSLKESVRDWERTFNSVSDAILIVDTEERVVRLNVSARAVLDERYMDVVGKPILGLLGHAKITESSIDAGDYPAERSFLLELQRNRATHTFEVSMTPLIQESERVGTVIVAKEITSKVQAEAEKRALEAQLQQAQKMEAIGTLAGGIAHNFNNLLMGIQGNASLILMGTDPDHPHYQKAKNVEKLVQSGSRLTSQLLGYAREGRFQIKPVSVNRLIRETGETFGLARKDIRIVQDLSEDIRAVLADEGQIEQVLMNLLVNAADAMPKGGTLYLKSENVSARSFSHKVHEVKPGNYVLMTIRDTGTGMDRKTLERIFEPFFTTKGMGKGTGLGLASVYGIVRAHGGYVDVESEEGRGTTFYIYLPAGGEPVSRDTEAMPVFTRGHEKVLLVDDEEMVLDVGQKILGAMGYDVSLAKSGKEAIDLYRDQNGRIDLVLLDMVMPDMCGGETYDSLKRINPAVKVLLSSGYSIDGQAAEILKRGCNGFIQKPFNMEQLSRKIRDVLQQPPPGCDMPECRA